MTLAATLAATMAASTTAIFPRMRRLLFSASRSRRQVTWGWIN